MLIGASFIPEVVDQRRQIFLHYLGAVDAVVETHTDDHAQPTVWLVAFLCYHRDDGLLQLKCVACL